VVADYEGLFRPPILLQAENDPSTQLIERPFKSSRRKSYAAVAIVGVLAASSAGALKHASTRDPIPAASSYAETAVSAEPAMSFTSNVTSQPGNKMSRPVAGAEISPKAVTVVTASSAVPAEQPMTKRTQIQIHAGDTFHDLAVRYLGSIDRTRELIMANPQIRNPDVIVPGQIVYLPSAQSAAAQE
jgi:nucleoid-associated protein YgaU